MNARKVIVFIMAVLMLPLLALGLIDPLEGSVALAAAIVLGVVVRLMSRVPVPKLAWISLLAWAAIFAGIIVMTLTATPVEDPAGAVDSDKAGYLPLAYLLWTAGAVTVAGAVVWVVRLFRWLREPVAAPPSAADSPS